MIKIESLLSYVQESSKNSIIYIDNKLEMMLIVFLNKIVSPYRKK